MERGAARRQMQERVNSALPTVENNYNLEESAGG